jgi:hypothetical protein
VVACGEHVCAEVEEVFGDLRRDAEAAGCVLGVDDCQLDIIRGANVGYMFPDDSATGTTEDVADEKDVQEKLQKRD